jgi:hypothetical protein
MRWSSDGERHSKSLPALWLSPTGTVLRKRAHDQPIVPLDDEDPEDAIMELGRFLCENRGLRDAGKSRSLLSEVAGRSLLDPALLSTRADS